MVDPHKIGRVIWSRTQRGLYVPHALHGRITESDEEVLARIYAALMEFKKLDQALIITSGAEWCGWTKIRPYLVDSMKHRGTARDMMMNGEWDSFWQSIDQRCVHSG